jgi:hypothetical protein
MNTENPYINPLFSKHPKRWLRLFSIWMILALAIPSQALSAVPLAQAQPAARPAAVNLAALTNTITLSVLSARDEPRFNGGGGVTKGAAITTYKYIINIDNTGTTEQRSPDPGTGCSPTDPGYPLSCHWVSIAGAATSSPVYTQGTQDDFNGVLGAGLTFPVTCTALQPCRYLISVLADGYKLDGAHFTIPIEAPGLVTVELQPTPLPVATIQAEVFEDISPVNSAPDVPAEHGLAGFEGQITDYLGLVTTDVFGNPMCTEYETDATGNVVLNPPDYTPTPIPGTGGACKSKCYIVSGGVDIGTVAPIDALGRCPLDTTGLTLTLEGKPIPAGAAIEGKVKLTNLGTNRYALSVIPPDGSGWIQTTTLEGNHDWDAWVMEGATGLDTEFVVAGEPFPAIIFGYVQPTPMPASAATGEIKGVVDAVKVYVPTVGGLALPGSIWGGLAGGKIDKPIDSPWIALTDLTNGDTAIYIGQGNADGSFDIQNVPDGNYTLSWWDEPQDYILDLMNVTVSGGEVVDLGILPLTGWWTQLDGYVFNDANRNGVMDWTDMNMDGCPNPGEGELGIANYTLTIRKRENSLMDRGATLMTTDQCGYYVAENGYPLTQWLVLEAYNDLYYTTGVTYQADNQPEPTTVVGAGVDVSFHPVIGLSGRVDWGVHAYDPTGATHGLDPRNGGIVGTVSYDTTRNELDPRYAVVEDWQPGIPDLPVNLYATVACPVPQGTADCDATGRYLLAADGSYAKGQLLNSYTTETWQRPGVNGDGICIPRNVDGNRLAYPADQQVTNNDSDCLEAPFMGVQFQHGYSTVDGNYGFADGCLGLGGYDPTANGGLGGCADLSAPTLLPGGRDYLVEVAIPNDATGKPLYQVTREEDINIANGDQFIPQVPPPACAGPLHTVDVATILTDTYPAVHLGNGITVPASTPVANATFADNLAGSPYEGLQKPMCNTKLVQLNNGKSVVPTFNLFTAVPLPGRFWGLLVDDLNFSSNPKSVSYGEKAGVPFAPVGIYDYTDRLVTTVESDYNGLFDVLLPSTNRISCPTPSGVCSNLYRFVGNDPGVPGRLNPNYNPQFRTIAAEFEAFPGLLVPADLAPTQVGVTIQLPGSQFNSPVSCSLPITTPQLFAVSQPYILGTGPFTIQGLGFGAIRGTGAVTLDNSPLPINAWSDTQIDTRVPGNIPAGPHQLKVTSANGQSSVNGLTFHVIKGSYQPNVYEVGPGKTYAPANTLPAAADHAIQNALDAAAASPGNDLVVVYPGLATPLDPRQNPRGAYYENLIISAPVKLQGVGPGGFQGTTFVPGSILDGGAFAGDSPVAADWVTKIAGLNWDGNQTVNDGAVISIFTQDGTFGGTFKAAIDGFDIRGGDQQGFPTNINQVGGGPTGLPAAIVTQGGAIFANAYAQYLQITNNVVQNNGGGYGTIRLGTPDLPEPNTNQHNENSRIAYNRIIANGGTNLAGGVGLFAGADNYEVAHNDICGNFSAEYGGGLSVYGYSPNGKIHDNRIYFNRSYDEGGGVMIAGQLPANTTTLSPGSGPVEIYDNLIQANLGNDDGGGVRFLMAGNFPMYVVNNMIVNNISTHEGGGISLNDAPDVRVYNNTIMKNITTATAVSSNGLPAPAGLSTSANSVLLQATLPGGAPIFSDPLLFNNIFWDNRAGTRAGACVTGIGAACDPSPTLLLNWDLGVADGTGLLSPTNSMLQVATGTFSSPTNQVGVDPRVVSSYTVSVAFTPWRTNPNFVDAIMVAADAPPTLMGNYHLTAASPAVNSGASSKTVGAVSVSAPNFDFDGQRRPFPFNGGNGPFDMGADERVTGSATFPTTLILDGFANLIVPQALRGAAITPTLGIDWDGDISGDIFAVTGDEVQVLQSGSIYWAGSAFDEGQEAYFTFTQVEPTATKQGVFLKFSGTSPTAADAALIEAVYDATSASVVISTLCPEQGWISRASFGATFAAGDQFGARALDSGDVEVYKNGSLLGSVEIYDGDDPWPTDYAAGSLIGVTFVADSFTSGAGFDNFGGGTALAAVPGTTIFLPLVIR